MAFPNSLLLAVLFSFLSLLPSAQSRLSTEYYNKTCPQFHNVMQRIIADKQLGAPTTAAAILRVFFHDCFVNGCDASLLIASNAFNKSELAADINLSLAGDAFDLIVRAKTALELECPGVVSCSDILAVSARDLVVMVGGPFYKVRLGRKDSKESDPSIVESNIPKTTTPMSEILALFAAKGFSAEEMVALTGAHTIGFSHCKEFANRIFNFSKTSEYDPAYNPVFAQGLRKLCANYTKSPEMSAFNDVFTPGKFDNMYFKNLQRGLGLLLSDQAMLTDNTTRPFVDLFAANQTAFFDTFARSMEKLSLYKIKRNREGEVRRRCDQFNTLQT
ncbi:PREDICTED: peroxidase 31 [Theobroma cacao]|uniref:Peroxidase n=1 Tax=Theobroma cacao TaxID=3641 RepID=A0AB32VKT5_THECC|nr:PREDICTED: peroxidase 31 [Theobroma cacao]